MNATHNRRATDRYPLTQRIHWSAMAWLDRNIGGVAGTLSMLAAWVVLAAFILGVQA